MTCYPFIPTACPSGVIKSGHILWLLGLPLSRVGLTIVLGSIENWSLSMVSSSGERVARFLAIRANTAHLAMPNIASSPKPTKASMMHAMITLMVSLGAEEPLGILGNVQSRQKPAEFASQPIFLSNWPTTATRAHVSMCQCASVPMC